MSTPSVAPGTPASRALRHVTSLATGGPLRGGLRVTLNFHPDRLTSGGVPLLRQLGRDGVYVSQFVSGTSNGGLTAWPGGDRWRWESRMFGRAYDGAGAGERPVYGALDDLRGPGGGAPRFGSSFLRLRDGALRRATFCYPDSADEPELFGVAERCDLVGRCRTGGRDVLDAYVEAHVHGPVSLERDVEVLVLDSAYRGTGVEEDASRLPCPVDWHPGFRLPVEVLDDKGEFRGERIVRLAREVAGPGGVLDPRIIGDAVRAGRHDPQDLKKVWHCLARFGAPAVQGDTTVPGDITVPGETAVAPAPAPAPEPAPAPRPQPAPAPTPAPQPSR
ncbi:DUF3626 domain-containing protein [Streptomyces sp. NPDC049954]|uniref:DUF3626 domain-containing protein n=1 Tax=Streptomyces sp. NPDC049954 TaxID=3155779 RepID=UPI00342161B1